MRHIFRIACFLLLPLVSANAYIGWQTTHGTWLSSGECKLVANSLRITVYPFHADVEEEATITPIGTVFDGDASTLEITGDFQMSSGTAVRSLLLWNGTKILKAKLKDRNIADSAYEAIVDRENLVPFRRDPAILSSLGNNNYQIRMYPVAINKSRRIRVLYSIPLQANNSETRFELKTIFTVGASQTPNQIPVEIVKGSSAFSKYVVQYGATRKTLQSGATYLIPYSDFYGCTMDDWGWNNFCGNLPLYIYPDSTSLNKAYSYKLDSTNAKGCYTAIFTTVPDSLNAMINELGISDFTLETKVTLGEKTYIANIPYRGGFGVYVKSKTPWDKKINWTLYNSNGISLYTMVQTIAVDSSSQYNSYLPLFWGAKYNFTNGTDNFGALYGYVDGLMSLLAVEKDSLPALEALKWADQGVPPLLPKEIIVLPGNMPTAPQNDIMFEFSSVAVALADATKTLSITCTAANRIDINLGKNITATMAITLFNLRGQVVFKASSVQVKAGLANVSLPHGLRGAYILRIQSGNTQINKKFILR